MLLALSICMRTPTIISHRVMAAAVAVVKELPLLWRMMILSEIMGQVMGMLTTSTTGQWEGCIK
jgi:hypothetical protein